MMQNRERGNSLVATMITVVIILVLMVVLFKGSSMFGFNKAQGPARADGKGTTVLGRVRYSAKDEVCRSNLGQVRASIQVYQTTSDDKPPESLVETRLGNDFYKCPLGGEPYQYDASSGRVRCPHPGHENY